MPLLTTGSPVRERGLQDAVPQVGGVLPPARTAGPQWDVPQRQPGAGVWQVWQVQGSVAFIQNG